MSSQILFSCLFPLEKPPKCDVSTCLECLRTIHMSQDDDIYLKHSLACSVHGGEEWGCPCMSCWGLGCQFWEQQKHQGKCWRPPWSLRQMKEALLVKPLWHHLLLPQKLRGERTKHSLSFPPTLGCQKCVLCRVQHKNPPAAAWEQLLPHPAPPHCQLWQSSHFSTSQDLPGTGFPLNLFNWGGSPSPSLSRASLLSEFGLKTQH